MEEETVQLIAEDGKTFEVKAEVAKEFQLFVLVLEDTKDRTIPVASATSHLLGKMVEFAEYKCQHPQMFKWTTHSYSKSRSGITFRVYSDEVKQWAFEHFFKSFTNLKELFDLVRQSNMLGLDDLFHLGSNEIANRIRECKDPAEVMEIFEIPQVTDELLEENWKRFEWTDCMYRWSKEATDAADPKNTKMDDDRKI